MKLILKYHKLIWLWLFAASCSMGDRDIAGIWHSELETVPGFRSALDFQLRHDMMSGKWSGRFELPETMGANELQAVHVKGSKVELNLGAGAMFKGEISNGKTIKGVLTVPGEKPEKLTFTKIPHWSSQVPARAGKDGVPIITWKYQPPTATGDGWQVAALRKSVLDSKPMNELLGQILLGKYHGLDALLIAQHGELLLEEYFYLGGRDRLHSIQSVTKSVTSLLIGTARDQGLIGNLDQPLKGYFPQYTDSTGTSSPTLRHALAMSAAIDWKEDIPYSNPENDAVRMNQSADLYQYVLSKNPDPVDKPGERFEYNSGLSILLGGVLLQTTGKPANEYARETLFKSLGIKHFAWTTMGNKVHTGGGLFLRPRDLLKIGQMVLDSGKWNGRQVVSQEWIRESTAFVLPLNKENNDFGYGYQWWRGVARNGPNAWPVIYAAGYGGQMLYIIPALDLVALTMHHNPTDNDGSHSITWQTMEKAVFPAFN